MSEIEHVYAHSLPNHPPVDWQTLEDHSRHVAELAAEFATPFGSSETARLLGMLHDIGKARQSFQSYLMRQNGMDDGMSDSSEHSHSGAGACWVADRLKQIGSFLVYPLAGHHAGLTDWYTTAVGGAALEPRLASEKYQLKEHNLDDWVKGHEAEWLRFRFAVPWKGFSPRDASFWVRMLYSCLVDADFLDTEAFMDKRQSDSRSGYESLSRLHDRFFSRLDALRSHADRTPVNILRDHVLKACESASALPRGLFSLTVPTGGGKTLSSTAFAFRHAREFGMGRIIYVIPYTSIIEQTSDVLRAFVGDENVLEHHCNLDPEKETTRSRLAAENWDAPIVVTTAVQFFESLYACKSSRCRKLHNISNSVVILDESQLLPANLLLPIAEAIHQLTAHYGCSIVLSTATQTSIGEMPSLKDDPIREIIPASWNLYKELKRTEIELPPREPRKPWSEVANELRAFEQVLCVVNTRKDCRELFDLMPEGTLHLSASMCGEHRSRVIAEIKHRLKNGEPVRVISTQLVEAGVDVDFPVVYRAFTGLPSIVQTAGRCNREGKRDIGRVVVFMPPEPSPQGGLRWYEDAFVSQLAAHPDIDLDMADVFPEFYRYFYKAQHDMGAEFKHLLQEDGEACNGIFSFRSAATKFNMIDSRGTMSVIVRFKDEDGKCLNQGLIDSLRAVGPKRDIMRKLQRYTVTIPKWTFTKMLENGAFSEAYEGSGIYVQEPDSVYSEQYGLDLGWQGMSIDETII